MRSRIIHGYSTNMHCVLVGNYGVGNVGDEALKEYFLTAFPDITWSVLYAHSEKGELPRLPAGLRSFCTTPWWKTLAAIKRSDAVVFGGGSLFTDVESSFACFLWFIHAKTAYLFGTPYVLAFQGIGPFRTRWGRRLARWAVAHAAFVSVRDEESLRRISEFTMHTKCERTFDPVILTIRKSYSSGSKNVITMIPRSNSGSQCIQAVQHVVSQYKDASVVVLLLQPEDSGEQSIARRILSLAGDRGEIVPVHTFDELCARVAGSVQVVSERYHGALAALALHVPVQIICQAEGDKHASLLPYANGSAPTEEMFTLAQHGEETLRAALKSICQ